MKKIMFYVGILLSASVNAQDYVHQVLILNEGYYDYGFQQIVEPVTVGVYDNLTQDYSTVAQLDGMRFASDLIIDDNVYYIAADTKIFKMDLNTHEVLASVSCQGVRNLAVVGDRLFATRGEYQVVLDSYLHVYNANDLSLELAFDTINGPKWSTQNLVANGNNVYIVINNAYESMNEKGIVGHINAETLSYENEFDLGPDALNPDNMLIFNNNLYTVNNKDWTGSSISKLDLDFTSSETVNLPNASTGCGTSAMRDDKLVYQISMENTINEFNCAAMNVSGPINGSFQNFYALKQNPVNGDFYASSTDFSTTGFINIYNEQNIMIGLFEVGVSPGTLVFDVRSSANLNEINTAFEVYPSPVQSILNVNTTLKNVKRIRNMLGEEILHFADSKIDVSELPNGIYYLEIENKSIRFVKN